MREEVIGRARLILGDCMEWLHMEQLYSVTRVGLIVTDPPYFLPAVHYNTRKEFPRSLTDLSILERYFAEFFELSASALGGRGPCYVFCDGQSYPAFYATAYRHFKKLRPLVWDKVSAFNGYTWRHQHELILFMEGEKCPPVPSGEGDILRFRAVPVEERDHPAQKPVDILKSLIEKHPDNGLAVLDPFMGSGATAVAAVRAGRSFIGIESEPAYFEIACRRVREASGIDSGPLFGEAAA